MLINWRRALVSAMVGAAGIVGAQLGPGDVTIVAVNTDDDSFAWVALREIPAGTTLHFTDSSVSNGLFRWSEHLGDVVSHGPLDWTLQAGLPAGTVVAIAARDAAARRRRRLRDGAVTRRPARLDRGPGRERGDRLPGLHLLARLD